MTGKAKPRAGMGGRLRSWLAGSGQKSFRQEGAVAYYVQPGQPVWSDRNYRQFAQEAFVRNVIAFRAVSMIAQGAASVPWKLEMMEGGMRRAVTEHPLLTLLHRPNPACGGAAFFESVFASRLISGNAYIQAVSANGAPRELYTLRPDRMQVLAGDGGLPQGYRYTVGDKVVDFPVDKLTGRAQILHFKSYHPLNDWVGLSPIEAAAYSIDQHNQAGAWNQALLQNGARPSGALVVRADKDGRAGNLSEEQYYRIRAQIDEQYAGPGNAGRPILLEGGLDWKEMSLSPKDMDFLEAKNSSAREIALAFGVPPQLLGIPGDNTYSNLAEARLALWEQTILPLLDNLADALTQWLAPSFGPRLAITYDSDGVSALAPRRDGVWARVKNADFLSVDEKRAVLGFGKQGNASV